MWPFVVSRLLQGQALSPDRSRRRNSVGKGQKVCEIPIKRTELVRWGERQWGRAGEFAKHAAGWQREGAGTSAHTLEAVHSEPAGRLTPKWTLAAAGQRRGHGAGLVLRCRQGIDIPISCHGGSPAPTEANGGRGPTPPSGRFLLGSAAAPGRSWGCPNWAPSIRLKFAARFTAARGGSGRRRWRRTRKSAPGRASGSLAWSVRVGCVLFGRRRPFRARCRGIRSVPVRTADRGNWCIAHGSETGSETGAKTHHAAQSARRPGA